MIVIRRLVDSHRSYTAIFLPGEPPKIFPTSDYEHARILQVYKQDRPHEGIMNDFSDYPELFTKQLKFAVANEPCP